MHDIGDDPRFHEGLKLLDAGDYFEASEVFEDLYFEAVRDEVELARVFLQVAVGKLHLERGQKRAGADRLDEAVKAIARVTNDRGIDLIALRDQLKELIADARRA